jgi:hypothetical protein
VAILCVANQLLCVPLDPFFESMAGVNEPVGFTEKSWLKVLFADLL